MQPGLVSILIVNWNTREAVLQLPRCASREHRRRAELRGDRRRQRLGRRLGGSAPGSGRTSRSSRNDENRGFAAAVNQAYARSSGEFVLLLNSDVDLTPGSLSALVRFLLDHPDVAGVGPLYLNPDGSPQPFHFRLPDLRRSSRNGSPSSAGSCPGATRILRDYRMLDDDFSSPLTSPAAFRELPPAQAIVPARRTVFSTSAIRSSSTTSCSHGDSPSADSELWVTPDAVVVHEAHSSARQLGQGAAASVPRLDRSHARGDGVAAEGLDVPRGHLLAEPRAVLDRDVRDVAPGIRPLARACRGPRPASGPSVSARLDGRRHGAVTRVREHARTGRG